MKKDKNVLIKRAMIVLEGEDFGQIAIGEIKEAGGRYFETKEKNTPCLSSGRLTKFFQNFATQLFELKFLKVLSRRIHWYHI